MENVTEISSQNSILNNLIAELRDKTGQKDGHRFRENISDIGFLMGYEISKDFNYRSIEVQTPLADTEVYVYAEDVVVLGILRASLPMQQGFLKAFRKADSAFISAYRSENKEGGFEIITEYEAMPNLNNKTVLMVDPMCATGSSMIACYHKLTNKYEPKKVIFASIFSSVKGLNNLNKVLPNIKHYTGVIDKELNAKSYIVPGLGDAGDLAFGIKE